MSWENVSPIALIVALIGAGGIGVFFRDVVNVFLKLRDGLSAREKNRKIDIVQQRDDAMKRERQAWAERDIAWQERDREASKRRRMEEYASQLRRALIESGQEPAPYPVLERTLPASEVRKLVEETEENQA